MENPSGTGKAWGPGRPKLSLREMQKTFTRTLVIESALTVFNERGFAAATMDDIASEAGLSRATIYLHFGNKAEILLAGIKQMSGLRAIHKRLDAARDRAEFEDIFGQIYDFWNSHSEPMWVHIREAAAMDSAVNDWLLYLIETYTRATQEFLERRGVNSTVARARAFLLQNMWGEFIYRLRDGGAELGREATVVALADFYEAAIKPVDFPS